MSEKPVPEVPPEGCTVPPFSTRVRFVKKLLEVKVTLHKIPWNTVNFKPTETHFYLDTMAFTKKYHLKFAYPQHITVDPEDCDATFEAGILYVVFKCKQIYDNFANKLLGKVTKSDLKKLKGETKKSSNVPELEPVDKDEEEENEDEASKEEEIKPKKMSIQRKRGKKPADKETSLKILEDINTKQDHQREAKLIKEAERQKYFEKKEEEKELRRSTRVARRQKAIALVENNMKTKQESSTKHKKRKSVHFEENESKDTKVSKR